jgi:hypothetical protein
MKFILAAALALAAQPVLAQTAPAPIQEVLGEITGREVTVSGQILRERHGYTLHTSNGWFPVEFAVDRATLERLRECPRNLTQELCRISASGVLWFDRSQPNLTLSDVVFTD